MLLFGNLTPVWDISFSSGHESSVLIFQIPLSNLAHIDGNITRLQPSQTVLKMISNVFVDQFLVTE